MIGVYQISINNKIYIGSSNNITKRWWTHLNALKNGKHDNKHLQRAYNKYGREQLVFSVLELVETPDMVLDVEQKHINELNPEYNICPVAGNCLGVKHSMICRQKHRAFRHSEETKRKISESGRGHGCSTETRNKIREKRLGYVPSVETIEKLRVSHVGKILSKESREKVKNANVGKTLSEETKRKISEKHKGMSHSDKTRERLREVNTGKKHTEESIQKMKESQRERRDRERTREIKHQDGAFLLQKNK